MQGSGHLVRSGAKNMADMSDGSQRSSCMLKTSAFSLCAWLLPMVFFCSIWVLSAISFPASRQTFPTAGLRFVALKHFSRQRPKKRCFLPTPKMLDPRKVQVYLHPWCCMVGDSKGETRCHWRFPLSARRRVFFVDLHSKIRVLQQSPERADSHDMQESVEGPSCCNFLSRDKHAEVTCEGLQFGLLNQDPWILVGH